MITPPTYPPTPLCSVGWPQLAFVGKIFSDKLFTCENRKRYPLHTNLLHVKQPKEGLIILHSNCYTPISYTIPVTLYLQSTYLLTKVRVNF